MRGIATFGDLNKASLHVFIFLQSIDYPVNLGLRQVKKTTLLSCSTINCNVLPTGVVSWSREPHYKRAMINACVCGTLCPALYFLYFITFPNIHLSTLFFSFRLSNLNFVTNSSCTLRPANNFETNCCPQQPQNPPLLRDLRWVGSQSQCRALI